LRNKPLKILWLFLSIDRVTTQTITNVEGEDKCYIFTSLKRRMFADFRSQCIIL
jgi:hypothetical protein